MLFLFFFCFFWVFSVSAGGFWFEGFFFDVLGLF